MKCNTKSSTETELVLLADKLINIVWMRYCIECQGYDNDKYIIFQDNMSALLLDENRCVLSSKQTKHNKAKYFLIKDDYDAGEIDVNFFPRMVRGLMCSLNLDKIRNSGTCMHSSRIVLEIMTKTQNIQ
jgi:hypothetical protein